jgi:hypothetical protein
MDRLITLPGGQSATLRRPEDVSERLRRPISRAMRGVRPGIQERGQVIARMDDGPDGRPTAEKLAAQAALQYDMTNEEADAYQDAGDYAAVALIEHWTFDLPISVDGLLDLPARTLDALRVAIAPHVSALFVDASPDPNPTAPSGGSNGSATPSAEVPQTTSLASGAPTSWSSGA